MVRFSLIERFYCSPKETRLAVEPSLCAVHWVSLALSAG